MAVTKKIGYSSVLAVCLLCMVCFQNCAVELSDQTYGASSACAPTGSQTVDFETSLTTFFQSTGSLAGGKQACGACHMTDSGNSAASRFGILPGTDTASMKMNWCSASTRAYDIRSGYLSSSHPGGTYTSSEIQELVDWAGTIQ